MDHLYYEQAKQYLATCDTWRAAGSGGGSGTASGDRAVAGTAQALAALVLPYEVGSSSDAELFAAITGCGTAPRLCR